MEELCRQFDYVESIKTEIQEGNYLVIMQLLKETYHIIKGDAPIPSCKICLRCGDALIYYEQLCQDCIRDVDSLEEDERLNSYAFVTDDEDDVTDIDIIYNR